MWNRNEDTICAVSTPHGFGGISVIRISGKQAILACKNISLSFNKKINIQSHRAYFSIINDELGNKIDEVIITCFTNGKSYTGEDVVEISCHGSIFITQQILELLVKSGCRIADKGEFTFRAFMNDKLDLVEAESVLGLIQSQNKASAKLALRQLDGQISVEYENLISDLTWCLAHIEAGIDFSEQGIDTVDNHHLIQKLTDLSNTLFKLLKSYESGKLIKNGIKLVLIGEPNVGKSSLLNLLVENEKAIVTPIAGTTRDIIDAEILYSGVKFSISDTAGIRETSNEIEIIGINRSKKEADKADIICFVLDSTSNFSDKLTLYNDFYHDKKIFFIFNKSDLISDEMKALILKNFKTDFPIVFTSALIKESRDILLSEILKSIGDISFLSEAVISSSRQYENTLLSYEKVMLTINELKNNIGSEFVVQHLTDALLSLQKILGIVYDDQIIDRVFNEFCLGK